MSAVKRLTADERQGIYDLMLLNDLAQKAKSELLDRLTLLRGGRRDMGLLASKSKTILEDTLSTVPVEQLIALRRNLKNMKYITGVFRPKETRDNDFGIWISYNTLNQIMDALRDHCLVCNKNLQEQRQCKLARALDELSSGNTGDETGCGYFVI